MDNVGPFITNGIHMYLTHGVNQGYCQMYFLSPASVNFHADRRLSLLGQVIKHFFGHNKIMERSFTYGHLKQKFMEKAFIYGTIKGQKRIIVIFLLFWIFWNCCIFWGGYCNFNYFDMNTKGELFGVVFWNNYSIIYFRNF